MFSYNRRAEFLVCPSGSVLAPIANSAVDSLMYSRAIWIVSVIISFADNPADDRFAVLGPMMSSRAMPGFVDCFATHLGSAQIMAMIVVELALEPANPRFLTIMSNRPGFRMFRSE